MKALRIVPVGGVELELLDLLASRIAALLQVSCHVETRRFDPEFAWEPRRQQFWSTRILKELPDRDTSGTHVLGVTDVDLFVPVLTFVFGEAQIGGSASLVSFHRLRNEFYGLPPDHELMLDRLVKEAIHEVGHNLGLRHCSDWECVMTSSHSVEKLDVKTDWFCRMCLRAIAA